MEQNNQLKIENDRAIKIACNAKNSKFYKELNYKIDNFNKSLYLNDSLPHNDYKSAP